MTNRELSLQEAGELSAIKRELDDAGNMLARGYKGTIGKRAAIYRAVAQRLEQKAKSLTESVPDVKPAVMPSMTEQRALGVEPAGDAL